MNHFEVRDILSTFRIYVDTREQVTPRAKERYETFGVPYERRTLAYGDYCGNIELPSGLMYPEDTAIKAACVVERKMSLDELAACFTRERDRFKREFERASANNAKVYLLVEGGSWEMILHHRYRSALNPEAFLASLTAWAVRYDLGVIFCKAENSGRMIKEILWRDMKERLERGA